jgi:adenine/guanine phosphoribosyltransferase-like PRPP-binding protein
MEFKESTGFRKSKIIQKEQSAAEVGKQVPEIKNEAIAELYEPMKKILQGMGEHIDKGEYSVILGEDASGRLPALLFRQILKTLYKEKDLPPPETRFFAGQRIGDPAQREKIVKEFKNFIEKSGAKETAENKKILVVSDIIQTGKNLFPFTNTLRAMKINFDIAAIGFLGGEFKPQRESIEHFLGGRIFLGMGDEPSVSGLNFISGVKKSAEPAVFAEPFPRPGKSKDDKKYYSQRRAARQDIKILAEKLVRWYKEKNSE